MLQAPIDKCDRVEDYKVAWEHFEKYLENRNERGSNKYTVY